MAHLRACEQAFSIFEILEKILSELPFISTVQATRVNRSFKTIVENSSLLRQKLFLRPQLIPRGLSPHKTLNPAILKPHHDLRRNRGYRRAIFVRPADLIEFPKTSHAGIRKMQLTNPPTKFADVWVPDPKKLNMVGLNRVADATGITLGTIIDELGLRDYPLYQVEIVLFNNPTFGGDDDENLLARSEQDGAKSNDAPTGFEEVDDGDEVEEVTLIPQPSALEQLESFLQA